MVHPTPPHPFGQTPSPGPVTFTGGAEIQRHRDRCEHEQSLTHYDLNCQTNQPACLFMYLSSIWPSTYLSIHTPIHLFIYQVVLKERLEGIHDVPTVII